MVSLNFLYAAFFLALTVTAFLTGQAQDARSLLFYGGAILICAAFALKSRRHGLAGAAMLSSLALFSTSSRLWGLIQQASTPNHTAFLLNIAAAAGSAAFLFLCFLRWQKSKRLAPPPEDA